MDIQDNAQIGLILEELQHLNYNLNQQSVMEMDLRHLRLNILPEMRK
jgi:hypothetical protein